MAKGPIITDRVKQLIAGVYLKDRDMRAKEIQEEVNRRLRGNGPGLSAVQKELTKIRQNIDEMPPELKGLDRPWSLATLKEYPIPSEALPTVLRAWLLMEKEQQQPVTIRQAQWVARLYAVIKDINQLAEKAGIYAALDAAAESVKGVLDTSESDIYLYGVMTGEKIPKELGWRILNKRGIRLQIGSTLTKPREPVEFNDEDLDWGATIVTTGGAAITTRGKRIAKEANHERTHNKEG